jgi:TPR repeat protein
LDEIKLAAEQGKGRAQFLLGLAYAKGEGVPQDLALAAKWYQKAGTQGDPNAQNNLGVLYVQGTGIGLNPVAAYACFSLAARGGVQGAAGNRDQLARILTADQLSEAVRMANRGAGELEGKP